MKTEESPAKIDAVPSPWWTSQSRMTILRALPSACIARAATAASLKTQYPAPWSRKAWWVPPARLIATVGGSEPATVRAAESVAPHDRTDRSTSSGDQGSPSTRTSATEIMPHRTRSR